MFDFFKRSRREINAENQRQGRAGEDATRAKYEMNGYKMIRTGRGHDFKSTKRNWFTGKSEKPIYIETKTGNAKLSKLQKKKKKQYGSRYVVDRPDEGFGSMGLGFGQ